ncbi:MAG: ClpX C4-type zinc finger protein [Pseudomonadota bacterium]
MKTPVDRARLDIRDKPYFVRVTDGVHLGYKKGKSIARWIVRWRVSSGYVSRTIKDVVPDDHILANNKTVLSYSEAIARISKMSVEQTDQEIEKQCGICGSTQSEVDVLVAGVKSYICDKCVERASTIIAQAGSTKEASMGGTVEVLFNPGIEMSICTEVLRRIIDSTAFAMAETDVRAALNGMLFEIGAEGVRAVATNGHYLAMCGAAIETGVKDLQHMILPRDGVVDLLAKLAESDASEVLVSIKDNSMFVQAEGIDFCEKLMLGAYPNYRDIVPAHSGTAQVDRREFSRHIEAQEPDESTYVRIKLTTDSLALSFDGENWEQMKAVFSGDETTAVFDCSYLNDILLVLTSDVVRLGFSSESPPWRLENDNQDDAIYLLMPAVE